MPPPPPQVFEATGTLTATTLRNASAPIAEAVSFEAYQRMQLPADEVCACKLGAARVARHTQTPCCIANA